MARASYEISNIQDMLQIPEERLDAFFSDLKLHLSLLRRTRESMDRLGKAIHPDLKISVSGNSLTWNDDGVNALHSVVSDVGGQHSIHPNPAFPKM